MPIFYPGIASLIKHADKGNTATEDFPTTPSRRPLAPTPQLAYLNIPTLLIRRHLRQPARRRHTRLIMDRAQQRRQTLEEIPNWRRRISHGTITPSSTRVPHINLGLQTVDSLRISIRQRLVCVVLQHEILHEALGSAEYRSHVAVGLGHGGETFGFALLGDELGGGFALAAEVVGLSGALGDEEVCFSLSLLGEEVCVCVLRPPEGCRLSIGLLAVLLTLGSLLLGVERSIGLLLRRFLRDGGLGDSRCAESLKFHECLLLLDFGVELGIAAFCFALCGYTGEVEVFADLDLLVGEFGVCLGLLGFALRLENGGCGVDLEEELVLDGL